MWFSECINRDKADVYKALGDWWWRVPRVPRSCWCECFLLQEEKLLLTVNGCFLLTFDKPQGVSMTSQPALLIINLWKWFCRDVFHSEEGSPSSWGGGLEPGGPGNQSGFHWAFPGRAGSTAPLVCQVIAPHNCCPAAFPRIRARRRAQVFHRTLSPLPGTRWTAAPWQGSSRFHSNIQKFWWTKTETETNTLTSPAPPPEDDSLKAVKRWQIHSHTQTFLEIRKLYDNNR